MKNKGKGVLSLLLVIAIMAVTAVVAVFGIGSNKYGSAESIKLGLDLAGGVSITYETVKEDPTQEEMDDIVYKMQLRAQSESTESEVYQEGENRINVDIPDVTDANEVLERLGRAGTIYFILGQGESQTANIKWNSTSQEFELTRSMEDIIADGDLVIDGSDITGAEAISYANELGQREYMVQLNLNDAGTKKFGTASTYANGYFNQYGSASTDPRMAIAIVYDNKVISAPRVESPITDGVASIMGQKDMDEANDLATVIRIGALPLELRQLRANVVGAKLGMDAINTSLLAGLIGFILVLLFMISWYRIPGVAASIALAFYVGLIVICLNIFNVTLTLPGMAGIILSVGMAVDANVIIFQRIREELATGKTVRSSMKLGFSKALSAIIDGNITTLIAAAVLFLRGSGPIKGFAQTLAIGIILSMFTALFVTKFVLNILYSLGFDDVKFYGIQKVKEHVFDFIGHGKRYALISGVLIFIGIGALIVNKVSDGEALSYGLEFKGGTSTQINFNDELPEDIKKTLPAVVSDELGMISEIVTVPADNAVIVKTHELTEEQNAALDSRIMKEFNLASDNITYTNISATVSGEMKTDAIWAVAIATICMLIYIWIRFKNVGFATSAVIALIHDVLVVLMVYAVAHISVGNTFIACMLTIVGYSINATIVIFDRIRESMKEKLKKDSIKDVVNASISQTFSRSINTSLTTLFMVLVLAILGVASIREFAIPLLAGIICGAYSSICITGCLWYVYQKRFGKSE